LREAPIGCDDWLSGAAGGACMNVFRWDTSNAGRGDSFVFYSSQVVPSVFLRSKVDFEANSGECSVIHQWDNTAYFADRGAGLVIGHGDQHTYLYTVISEDPTQSGSRPLRGYRVDAALNKVNGTWLLDSSTFPGSIDTKEYQLAN
jgi:hypothetical protein